MEQEEYFKEIAKIAETRRIENFSVSELAAYHTGQSKAFLEILSHLSPQKAEMLSHRLHSRYEIKDLCILEIRKLQERLTRAKDIFRKLRAENEKLRQWELPF
jgi:hypothetical protein